MKILDVLFFAIAMTILWTSSACATFSDDITVDTSSVYGDHGFIDFQFNYGAIYTTPAYATITNWSSDSTLGDETTISTLGDVTGTLPTVTLNNEGMLNEYNQELTFGSTITFDLTISSATDDSFGLSFFTSDDSTPILTPDGSGFAARINLDDTGTATPIIYSQQVGIAQNSAVPEPSSLLLIAAIFGLAGLIKLKKPCPSLNFHDRSKV